MEIDVAIRDEAASDAEAIFEVTKAAFADMPYSDQTEHFIVNALREAKALTVSLVAEAGGEMVGHIAFSPVTISDGSTGWYGLGPVSVRPDMQRKGIGKALVREGLARLKATGAKGCLLVGHPDYYQQFGFRNSEDLAFEGVEAKYFFVLPFTESGARGTVQFHPAFWVKG